MSDSEEPEDPDLPDAATAQSRCEQFAAITGTDTACAQFFLQDRKWELERSVNDYFDMKKSGALPFAHDSEENVPNIDASTVEEPEPPPEKMVFITYNIDGLNDKSVIPRTKGVCDIIKREEADVVFLQEVIPETYSCIEQGLPGYKCISGGSDGYFTTTLLRTKTVTYNEHEIVRFPTSVMERNMLIVKAKIASASLILVNCHLESTKDHAAERLKQLRMAFKYVVAQDQHYTVFFAGDLNLRDKELEQIGGIPPGIDDLWIACGSRPECTYTWDAQRNDNTEIPGRFKPRMRFDRVYLQHSSPWKIVPKHFGLVGIEKLKSCGRFPSDHWGLIVHSKITE